MTGSARRELENVMRSVFKRCQLCPNDAKPSCSGLVCGNGQSCVYVPQNCDNCAHVKCMSTDENPTIGKSSTHESPNVGAIAGGVVGGVIFIVIMVFVIWKFCLKGRRQQYEEGQWHQVDVAAQEKADEFASRRSTRASTHTVASIASSVLTRASNIIQIAYIPGVTNRSGPGSPDLLVPPVPPIPAMSPTSASGFSTPYATSEQHFFVPDFRDSMASSMTGGYSNYARTSLAPSLARTSVASTVYRQNAIVSPLPAQTIVRGKAAVVSVKSSGSNSPTGIETPPVPQIDPKHSNTLRVQMPLSRDNSVRSGTGKVRALHITKKKSTDVSPPKSSRSSSTASTPDTIIQIRPFTETSFDSTDDDTAHTRARRTAHPDSDSESDEDDHSRARRSLLRASASTHESDLTEIQDTPTPLQSPFSDNSTSDCSRPDLSYRDTYSSVGLRPGPPMSPIREESSKRTSQASKRTQSPFSDDNRSDL